MKYLYINKYWELNKEYNTDKILYLMIDRPNKIFNNGSYFWKNNKDQSHRDYNLPSKIYDYKHNKTCDLFWDIHNHDYNKPAIIYYDGDKLWLKKPMTMPVVIILPSLIATITIIIRIIIKIIVAII